MNKKNKIIDGKKISSEIKKKTKKDVGKLKIKPGLAMILVGDNPASKIYIRNKEKACVEVGIKSVVYNLEKKINENNLLRLIKKLNKDKKINGIIVQLPLPEHISISKVTEAIDPKKDVDCFHPNNIGKLFFNRAYLLPCTPAGIIELIKKSTKSIKGKNCVVVGRSNIVGKPVSLMLLQEDATVTIAHSKTKSLKKLTKQADILVVAIGKPKFIKKDFIKKGAVVIDVGINRDKKGKLCGDVDFENVIDVVGAITPVPGGVGPMTVAMLLKNCVKTNIL